MFTADDVLRVLEGVVAEAGEFKENPGVRGRAGCRYTDPANKPSCIAGTALHRMGFPLPAPNDDNLNFATVDEVAMALGFRGQLTDEAVDLLQDAQVEADRGATWGQVVRLLTPDA